MTSTTTNLDSSILDMIDLAGAVPGVRNMWCEVTVPQLCYAARKFGTERQIRSALARLEEAGKVKIRKPRGVGRPAAVRTQRSLRSERATNR